MRGNFPPAVLRVPVRNVHSGGPLLYLNAEDARLRALSEPVQNAMSKECQAAHWKLHEKTRHPLSDGEVWGIEILDMNRRAPWSRHLQHVLLEPAHPVFTRPLVDNQPAVYLRIEPDTQWVCADACIVVRKDRNLLTLQAIEIVYNFHVYLLDTIQDERSEGRPLWDEPLSAKRLGVFADDYRENVKRQGRLGFDYFP